MTTKVTTVADYLAALPDDRRAALAELRKIILLNLPKGYEEVINWGMITYEVPLAIEPKTYNGQPLMYAAIGNQKNNMVIHLLSLYSLPDAAAEFTKAWSAKKLDMGKACIRFKKFEDLDQPLIGKTIAATSVSSFVDIFKQRKAQKGTKP